jgi:hypothetical protein
MTSDRHAVKVALPEEGVKEFTVWCSGAEKTAMITANIDIIDKLYAE